MKTLQILLVEDSPSDVFLMKEAAREAKTSWQVYVVGDGIEALAFLRRHGKYAAARGPDIILLDLNLPRKDGREVLAEIKNDPDLRRIPVIVLTSSKTERDLLEAYDLHAACYIVKPGDFARFAEILMLTEKFWADVVKLAPR